MPVTINVNGLSLVHQASDGVSRATLPDVCKTPLAGGAPVPYSNTSLSRDLAGGTRSVRVDGGFSAAVSGSTFARSTGDEDGTLGGVTSRVFAHESSWLTHSFDVRLEGRPACRLTDKMLHNAGNTVDCAGETQPVVEKGGTVVNLRKVKSEYTGPYSLEVTVTAERVESGKTKKQRVENARVRATAVDKGRDREEAAIDFLEKPKKLPGRSWEGDTKPGKRGGRVGACTFKGLAKRRYEVEVFHDCYAEDPKNRRSVVVDGRPKRHKAKMTTGHLRTVANAKNVTIGARADSLAGREGDTLKAELNEVIQGTFFASRCGDDYILVWNDDPAKRVTVPMNRELTDLSRKPDGTFTQEPSFDFAPTQDVIDKAAALGFGIAPSGQQGLLDFAAAANLTVQGTPLVWPSPANTPGWPNGTVDAPGGYVDRRASALVNGGMAREAAVRTAVREVLESFIVKVMGFGKDKALANGQKAIKSWIVVNEILNLRYHGFQENATTEKVYARQHPFWKAFGLWEVADKYRHTKADYKDIWDHVRFCFEVAHRTDPEALLILNDYNVEYLPKKWKRADLERATERALVEPRRKRDKAIGRADDARDRSEKRIRERWERKEDDRRPSAPKGAATAYKDALAAADRAFDKAMLEAERDLERALRKAEDHSDGDPRDEAKYAADVAKADQAYGAQATAAATAYQNALTAAQTQFATARAAETQKPGAPAEAEVQRANEAQRKFSASRMKAADRRFADLRSLAKKHAAAVHKATSSFGKTKSKEAGSRDAHIARWEKPELFYELAEWLTKVLPSPVRKRLAIGFQMHHPDGYLGKGYSPKAIAAQVRRFAKLDLPVVVTELDVDVESTHIALNQASIDRWERERDRWRRKVARWKKKPAGSRGPKPKLRKRPEPATLQRAHQAALASAATDDARHAAELAFYKKHKKVFQPAFREQAERARRMIEALLSSRNCLSINSWGIGDRPTSFRYCGYWFHWGYPCETKDCLTHNTPGILDRKPMYTASVAAFLRAKKQFSDQEIRQGLARRWAHKLDKAERRSTKK